MMIIKFDTYITEAKNNNLVQEGVNYFMDLYDSKSDELMQQHYKKALEDLDILWDNKMKIPEALHDIYCLLYVLYSLTISKSLNKAPKTWWYKTYEDIISNTFKNMDIFAFTKLSAGYFIAIRDEIKNNILKEVEQLINNTDTYFSLKEFIDIIFEDDGFGRIWIKRNIIPPTKNNYFTNINGTESNVFIFLRKIFTKHPPKWKSRGDKTGLWDMKMEIK